MPELPEVETIRLMLEPHLVGRRFDRVEIDDARLVRTHEPGVVDPHALEGATDELGLEADADSLDLG